MSAGATPSRPRVQDAADLFQELRGRARRLERSVFAMVVLVTLAPPALFLTTELVQRRERGRLQGIHAAEMVTTYVRLQGADKTRLAEALRPDVDSAALSFVRLRGESGSELLSIGDVREPPDVVVALAAEAAPYRFLEAGVGRGKPKGELALIVAIHALVGAVLGFGFYLIPVKALGQAIQELEGTKAQLIHAEKLSAIGEIYAGLTHEINNPLGIILTRVRLLLASAPDLRLDAETVKDLEMIERHGGRIAEIIRGLLAFARKTEAEMAPTDLNRIVREVVALVEKPFQKEGIAMETVLADSLPQLLASRDQIQQVFLNLVNNARDAMPHGGRIVIRTRRSAGHLVAEVEDSGTGLSPEARGRLFEPFFTTKAVGKGTGLGLSVSYGIVKAHGGEIAAENVNGAGALFRLTLPAVPVERA